MKIEKHRKVFKVLIKIKNIHAVTYNHGDVYIHTFKEFNTKIKRILCGNVITIFTYSKICKMLLHSP